jgi:hypothetical protein
MYINIDLRGWQAMSQRMGRRNSSLAQQGVNYINTVDNPHTMAGYNFWKRLVAVCKASTLSHGPCQRTIILQHKQHDKSVSPMATTPLRISSVVVVISKRLSIESLLKSFKIASKAFPLQKRKVSLCH